MKKYFYFNATKVCYNVLGQDNTDCILFLHGWGTSSALWIDIFKYLSKNYKLIFLDFPPFGCSGDLLSPWSLQDYSKCVSTLLKKLNINSCSIICHSFGFRVAIVLCKNGFKVNKIIVMGGAGIKKKCFIVKTKILFYKTKKLLSKIKLYDKDKLQSCGSQDYKTLSPIMKQTFVNIINCDLKTYLPYILAQTLLLYAQDDKETPVKIAKIFKKKIKNSSLYIFKSGGHFLFLTNTIAITNAVNIFLKKED